MIDTDLDWSTLLDEVTAADECCDRVDPPCDNEAVRKVLCGPDERVNPEEMCTCGRTILVCLRCFDEVSRGVLWVCLKCEGYMKIVYAEAVRRT